MADKPEHDDIFTTPEGVRRRAMDLRLGREGEARPHGVTPMQADRVEVKRAASPKKRTERTFNVIFGIIGALMVAGMLTTLYLMRAPTSTQVGAEAPAETPAEAEQPDELQGGIEVRKGIGKH